MLQYKKSMGVMQMLSDQFDAQLMGLRLKQKRKAQGLRQRELAARLGLSDNHISNIERGKYLPSLPCLLRLCDVLGETPDYYLFGRVSRARADALARCLAQCTAAEQETVCRLLEVYLAQKSDR